MKCPVCGKDEMTIKSDHSEIVCSSCGLMYGRQRQAVNFGIPFRWKLGWVIALALFLVYVKTGYELNKTVKAHQELVAKCKDLVMQVGHLRFELDDMAKAMTRLVGESVIDGIKK